ncbi:MAG TPA: CbiX/SirB N-terminal domain-containing protein [Verrucomicrobiae bacterium]|nr:CbiX/SirB N-terminal domain-containing protein [Verrucomicrobiae bacterium]
MSQKDFSDAALLLVGHGSTQNADSAAPVFQHAAELRRRRLFAQVREGFWKQEPKVVEVLPQLTEGRVFIVPLFISEGYFSENIIPHALGFSPPLERMRASAAQSQFYCRPVGSHPSMTNVLLSRASRVIEQFPFPRAPKSRDITLFIAGHGTEQDQQSREAIDKQVELIRKMDSYAAVEPIFLEQEPRIGTCYQTARTKNIVIVPFFISEGLHVAEDLPVLLGEPERIVKQRLERRQATWRNPTERHGKLVWLGSSVGTEPLLAEVILARVEEAAKGANPKAEIRRPKSEETA